MDSNHKSTSSKIAKKRIKESENRCVHLRPRNLYLIKDTLQSFGSIQLPNKFDVLRRTMYCLLVERREQQFAYSFVADEIIKLYTDYGIDTIEKPKIVKMISKLIKDYLKIVRNQNIIDNLNLRDKIDDKNAIIEIFEEENEYLYDLGYIFNAYDENAAEKLKKLKKSNGDKTYNFFIEQLKNKDTGLIRDSKLRYNELVRRG